MSVAEIKTANLCGCGCGELAGFAKQSETRKGLNGRSKNSSGYTMLSRPGHPRADKKGYVLEHLLVAEQALGRPIEAKHPVHHVNDIKNENRSTNLVICEDQEYHLLLHKRERSYRASGNPDWLICNICGVCDSPSAMYAPNCGTGTSTYHLKCLYARRASKNVTFRQRS